MGERHVGGQVGRDRLGESERQGDRDRLGERERQAERD